jgi:energy-coupling factor transport system substrate-specific component
MQKRQENPLAKTENGERGVQTGHRASSRAPNPAASRLYAASRILDRVMMLVVSMIGIAAFLYPFFQPREQGAAMHGAAAHGQDALLMFVVLIVLSLGAVMGNMLSGSGGLNSKMVAALGVLTAINAVLRVVPGPVGFSAMFALPILTGYCYGSTFGYLLGTLSMAVSALLGAGVGPWLPYQMFTVGWVGLTSAWLPDMHRRPWLEVTVLTAWGLVWGMAFGFVMNLWFWPFVFSPVQADMYWQPGMGALETFKRYLAFYGLTSSWWDVGRAGGNALLIALFGAPVLRLLRRFGRRFTFVVRG